MRSILPLALLTTLATSTPIHLLPRQQSTCPSTPGAADRRGAAAVAQQLIQDANASSDQETGGILVAGTDPVRVASYVWEEEKEENGTMMTHESYVDIRSTISTTEKGVEIDISRRNVYGVVMDLIYACSDRRCTADDCPVNGVGTSPSDPGVEVRLWGNNGLEDEAAADKC